MFYVQSNYFVLSFFRFLSKPYQGNPHPPFHGSIVGDFIGWLFAPPIFIGKLQIERAIVRHPSARLGEGGGSGGGPKYYDTINNEIFLQSPTHHQPSLKGEMHIQDLIPTSMPFEDEIQRTVSSPTPPH